MRAGRRPGAAQAAPGSPGRRARRGGSGRDEVSDGGFATAETAVVIPGLLMVAFVLVWAVCLVAGQLSCIDAARVGARAVARGESIEAARAVALEAAPAGAHVEISRGARHVLVVVTWASQAPGHLPMPPVTVVGKAVADDETARDESAWDESGPEVSEIVRAIEARRAQRISRLGQGP